MLTICLKIVPWDSFIVFSYDNDFVIDRNVIKRTADWFWILDTNKILLVLQTLQKIHLKLLTRPDLEHSDQDMCNQSNHLPG